MALKYRRLRDDEVVAKFPQRGHQNLAEYEAIFEGAENGWSFEIDREGLSVRSLKRRLGQAVKRQLGSDNVKASLRYVGDDENSSTLAFQVKLHAVESANGSSAPRRTARKRELVPA